MNEWDLPYFLPVHTNYTAKKLIDEKMCAKVESPESPKGIIIYKQSMNVHCYTLLARPLDKEESMVQSSV